MTIKQFCTTMIIVEFCSSMIPILPQRRVAKASTRGVASSTASTTRGRSSVQRAVSAKVQKRQAAVNAVVATTPTTSAVQSAVAVTATPTTSAVQSAVAATATPVASAVQSAATAVATPALAGGPTVVSPFPVVPVAADENQKKVWLEMQDILNMLQGAQVFFHPTIAPYNGVSKVNDFWVSTNTKAVFKFLVAAKQDAVFQFIGETIRTITLGANGNTNFIVRIGDVNAAGQTVSVTPGMTILEGETAYAPFWVSYDKTSGELKIGKGDVDTNVLMTWIDPTPLKNSSIKLGLGGWADAKGSKVFYNNIYVVLPTGACVLAQANVSVETPTTPTTSTAATTPATSTAKVAKVTTSRGRALARGKTTGTGTSTTSTVATGTTGAVASTTSAAKTSARRTVTRRTR